MPHTVTEGTTLIRLFVGDCLDFRRIESPEDQQILQNDLDLYEVQCEQM